MNEDFGGQEALTASVTHWRYGAPVNTRSKCLLLTSQKIAIVGEWGSGLGVIAWCPLPKRDKKHELSVGL